MTIDRRQAQETRKKRGEMKSITGKNEATNEVS